MEIKEIARHLQQIPLFQKLKDDERDLIELYQVASLVKELEYAPGERLFGQGELAEGLYYVLRGRIQLTRIGADGVRTDLGMKQPGNAFGETGVLVGEFHDATAEALSPVRVLYLARSDFLPLLEHRPRLRQRLTLSPDMLRKQQVPRFPWMREDEWAIHLSRRHLIGLIRRIILPLLALLLVVVLAYVLAGISPILGLVVGLLLSLFPAGLLAWDYIDWYDDRFILTTQRVVHLERRGPFGSHSEEAALDDIQDVLEVRPSVLANLLDYGDIVLQTAGGTVKIDFTEVGQPTLWREMILREMGRLQARRRVQLHSQTRQQLEARLNLTPLPESTGVAPPPSKQTAPTTLFFHALRELLFPPSWVESPDKLTIKWRRFWLPGFFHYWWVSVLFLLITVGGAILLAHWATFEPHTMTLWLPFWLLAEVVLLGLVLWYIEDWRNDFFEITPTHIIHVDRTPLWGRITRREARLDRIQNITSNVPSLWARLLRYGSVMLETAGAEGQFEIRYVRDPERVRAEISRRQQEFRKRELTRQAAQRQDELLSWFAIYDSIRHPRPASEAADEAVG